MPLSPEDVRNKRFTPVRLREGYDMGEVDQFLDEVESELERLTAENDDLRLKLTAASSGDPTRAPSLPSAAQPDQAASVSESRPAAAASPLEAAPAAASTVTVPEASSAAARLLELATRNADELVAEAKEQADRILTEARTKSERMENDARGRADRVESDARTRSQKLDSETATRREQLFGELEKDRDRLAREVEHLRGFEREYRSRLKSYLQNQLSALDGEEPVGAPLTEAESEVSPRRLRTLLGESSNAE